jgi:hypothetical protein
MHTQNLPDWTHEHVFCEGNDAAERGIRGLKGITAVITVGEGLGMT